jgi:hypothetical protein
VRRAELTEIPFPGLARFLVDAGIHGSGCRVNGRREPIACDGPKGRHWRGASELIIGRRGRRLCACDIDLERCTMRVARSLVQMNDGVLFEDEPKSRRAPGGRLPPRDRARIPLTPGEVCRARPGQPCLYWPEGWPPSPVQLPTDLDQGAG